MNGPNNVRSKVGRVEGEPATVNLGILKKKFMWTSDFNSYLIKPDMASKIY